MNPKYEDRVKELVSEATNIYNLKGRTDFDEFVEHRILDSDILEKINEFVLLRNQNASRRLLFRISSVDELEMVDYVLNNSRQ